MTLDSTSSSQPLVALHVDDAVLSITLQSAATGNALDLAMTAALADALERVNAMPGVNCVILRSGAKHFCTGGNVNDMLDGADLMAGSVTDVRDRLRHGLHRITRALYGIEVPVIAAVNGSAIGAGLDVALMCDIRIAGERAQFAESFLRLGLVSGIGGAWFLTRLVGLAKAMELTLTSEFLDAATALHLGIVTKVVPHDDLDAEALALARRIAANTPIALRMNKRLVRESAAVPLDTALEMAASLQAMLLCGDEHKAKVRQFIEDSARARRAAST